MLLLVCYFDYWNKRKTDSNMFEPAMTHYFFLCTHKHTHKFLEVKDPTKLNVKKKKKWPHAANLAAAFGI